MKVTDFSDRKKLAKKQILDNYEHFMIMHY